MQKLQGIRVTCAMAKIIIFSIEICKVSYKYRTRFPASSDGLHQIYHSFYQTLLLLHNSTKLSLLQISSSS